MHRGQHIHQVVQQMEVATFFEDRRLTKDVVEVEHDLLALLQGLGKVAGVDQHSQVEEPDSAISCLAEIDGELVRCSLALDWLCQVERPHLHIRQEEQRET